MDNQKIIWGALAVSLASVFLPWVGIFGWNFTGIQVWPGQLGLVVTLVGAGMAWKEVKLAYLAGVVNVLLGLYVLGALGGLSKIGCLLFVASSGAFTFLSFTKGK